MNVWLLIGLESKEFSVIMVRQLDGGRKVSGSHLLLHFNRF